MSTISHRPTVLVLGAGASYDIGFPTAAELRNLIIDLPGPNSDGRFARLLAPWDYNSKERDLVASDHLNAKEYFCERFLLSPMFGMPQLVEMRRQFKNSNLSSIDTWLRTERGSDYADFARRLIASTLLACEKMVTPSGGWYASFLNRLYLANNPGRLSIVTFNYDRSLRHFLFSSAQNWFHNLKDAWEFAHNIEILPVYGSLGAFDGDIPVPYGDTSKHKVAAKNIELMRPHTQAPEEVRRRIREAEQLYFMGFAYDRLNLDALGISPESKTSGDTKVYGTTYKVAQETLLYFRQCLGRNQPANFPSILCDQFFETTVNLRLS